MEAAQRCPYNTVTHVCSPALPPSLLTVSQLLHEAAYGEGSPLGSSPFPLDLGNLDVSEVLAFRARQFVAPNVTVIGNGLSADALEKFASSIAPGTAAVSESPYVGGTVRRRVDAGGRIHTTLAFPAASGQKGSSSLSLLSLPHPPPPPLQARPSLCSRRHSKAKSPAPPTSLPS
jgi:hypothetical protein